MKTLDVNSRADDSGDRAAGCGSKHLQHPTGYFALDRWYWNGRLGRHLVSVLVSLQ
jgi:hypothetical protein